jgi:hypothetical protein
MKTLGVVIVVTIFATFALAMGWWMVEESRSNAFYENIPFMRDMIEAGSSEPEDRLAGMTKLLLERIPVGTTRDQALRTLTSEKIVCRSPEKQLSSMLCSPFRNPDRRRRLTIELFFNAADELSSGRVVRFR